MTRGEWVLLAGPLGMLGLLGFAFAMNSDSLSEPRSANEIDASRVCAYLCDANLAGKSCEVFCTSRRQSSDQFDTVANEKDVVVVVGAKVRGTRHRACPTLCRHGLGVPLCACDPEVSGVAVSWEQVCASFCEDQVQPPGCLRCLSRNNERNHGVDDSFIIAFETTSVDIDVLPTPRDTEREREREKERERERESYVTGETDDAETLRQVNQERSSEEFDWEKFCEAECKRGNGGLACRCDIIP